MVRHDPRASANHRTPTDATDVADLIDQLTRAYEAITPAQFLSSAGNGLRSPGLYSWWVDVEGASDLTAGLGHAVAPGLIYAGLAGATRSRSGKKSTNTLWGRINSMHLGGNHEFSTLRLSLGSILAEARGEVDIDEDALTAWMHKHLHLIAVPVANADTLGEVESAILTALDPPLNLNKLDQTPLRKRLSALRKTHGR